ncbi:hypothetical protein ACFYV7_04455 [Nocardia suismassiliense]|uniref:Secreted protein n=1 Tax=Nocardia suismassiliense TaxID=2077092 RepID=A0ABW6QLS3_9NOCA
MFAVRGFAAAAIIGAATMIGAGAAAAAPLPLEPHAPQVETVQGSCGGVTHPFALLVCTISSLSG